MNFQFRALGTFVSQLAQLVAGLLASVLVARWLGPAGKGTYSLALQTAGFALLFGRLGVDLGVIYFAAKEEFPEKELKATSFWFGALWGIVVGISTFAVALNLRGSALRGLPVEVLVPAIAAVPFMLTLTYQQSYLLGRNRVFAYNSVNIGTSGSTLLFLLVAIVGLKTGVIGATWAYLAACVAALAMAVQANHTPVLHLASVKNVGMVRKLVAYGIKPQLGNVFQFFSYRLDMFIVNAFNGAASVGYYSIAVLMAEAIWYIPNAVSLVLLPHVAASSNKNADYITPIICRNTVFLSLLASLGMAALAPLFVRVVFSRTFLPAVVPLWWLLPGTVALSLDKPIASYQFGQGRPQISLYVVLLSTPFTLAAYLLLIPKFGIVGAAIGSSISYAVTTAIEIFFLYRTSSIRLTELLVPQRSDWALYRTFLAQMRQFVAQQKDWLQCATMGW